MWIDKWIPALRRRPAYALVAAVVLVAAAVATRYLLPGLPPFLTLFAAVLCSAFIGGVRPGIAALSLGVLVAPFMISPQAPLAIDTSSAVSIVGFALVSGLIVFIVNLLDQSIHRLERERERLELALRAAKAAIWEIAPGKYIRWDKNFYDLVGLDPSGAPPSTERFLSMVYPEDRAPMAEARSRMEAGQEPRLRDEYRLIRPDGRTVWLENHRTAVGDSDRHFIGITQDITARKESEERVRALLLELAHRVKNQYAVILAMIRETNRQARSSDEFEELISSRILGLSRSHDLLLEVNWEGIGMAELLRAQLNVFGVLDRCDLAGPELVLSPFATQQLGMAFHELATNSIKHGALSSKKGRVSVTWDLAASGPTNGAYRLTWKEPSGPSASKLSSSGFGTKVLTKLTPAALSGTAELRIDETGLIWTLAAERGLQSDQHQVVQSETASERGRV